MQLRSFIRASGLSDQHFADALGVSLSGLRKWKARKREPDAATMVKIEELTAGAVRLVDWAEPVDRIDSADAQVAA